MRGASRSSPAQLMHGVDHQLHVIDGRAREDAVAEIENVAGAVVRLLEDAFDLCANHVRLREQHHRIEVPLNPHVVADRFPRVV